MSRREEDMNEGNEEPEIQQEPEEVDAQPSRRPVGRGAYPKASFKNVRIDARPRSAETAAGARNLHRDTDGSVIGGIDAYGRPFGSRVKRGPADGSDLGKPVTLGLDRQAAMNAKAVPAASTAPAPSWRTVAAPAGSQLLADRQKLHSEMVAAGAGAITPEMEARSKALGVSDTSFRRIASQLGPAAVAAVPAKPVQGPPKPPAAPQAPAAPAPVAAPPAAISAVQVGAKPFQPGSDAPGLTPQVAAATPGPVPPAAAGGVRTNRLTGKPMGYLPGDDAAMAGGPKRKPSWRV